MVGWNAFLNLRRYAARCLRVKKAKTAAMLLQAASLEAILNDRSGFL